MLAPISVVTFPVQSSTLPVLNRFKWAKFTPDISPKYYHRSCKWYIHIWCNVSFFYKYLLSYKVLNTYVFNTSQKEIPICLKFENFYCSNLFRKNFYGRNMEFGKYTISLSGWGCIRSFRSSNLSNFLHKTFQRLRMCV